MPENSFEPSSRDHHLFSNLLGEICSIQELLQVIEVDSVSVEEAVSMVDGIQRDIIQLYRAAQG